MTKDFDSPSTRIKKKSNLKKYIEDEIEALNKEDLIDTREIESALAHDQVDNAPRLLEQFRKKYSEYKDTIEKLESLY